MSLYASTRHRIISGKPRHLGGWKPGARPPKGLKVARAPFGAIFGPSRAVLPHVDGMRVEDQGYRGTCVAQTWTSIGEYLALALYGQTTQYSALALYAWLRRAMGVPLTEDSGSFNSTAVQVLGSYGFPLEADWPYDLDQWDQYPPGFAAANATACKLGLSYLAPSVSTIEASIRQGRPVSVGFECFESLDSDETSRTGYVAFKPDERVIGGHAVVIVGYDRIREAFIFMNSWGTSWGFELPEAKSRGFGYLPYEYVKKGYATDTYSARTLVRGS